MDRKPEPQASGSLNKLNLSETDLNTLADLVIKARESSGRQPIHTGERYVEIPKSALNQGKPLHLKVPAVLEKLPDNDPRIISWVMSEIYAVAYKPGFYRANTTDVSMINDKKGPLYFASHFHAPSINSPTKV